MFTWFSFCLTGSSFPVTSFNVLTCKSLSLDVSVLYLPLWAHDFSRVNMLIAFLFHFLISLCLSLSNSVSLYVCVCLYMSVSLTLSVSVSLCLSVCILFCFLSCHISSSSHILLFVQSIYIQNLPSSHFKSYHLM